MLQRRGRYPTMTYLRGTYQNPQVLSQIVQIKTRVSPVKALLILQLELISSLLLARSIHNVHFDLLRRFKISHISYLSDSLITLKSIHNENRQYKQFVENPIREIRELTKKNMSFNVPGKENVSDLPLKKYLPE